MARRIGIVKRARRRTAVRFTEDTPISFDAPSDDDASFAEPIVPAVDVCGVVIPPTGDGFNVRASSVIASPDRLIANRDSSGTAAPPVTIRIYGGWAYPVPMSDLPRLTVSPATARLERL